MKLTLLKKAEVLEFNLKTHMNQQQQQNPETLSSWQGPSEVQKTKSCFGTHLDHD